MADFNSTQLANAAAGTFVYPIDNYGKMRISYFDFTAAAAGGEPDTISLFKLPPGRVRVFPALSRISCSALGAGALLDLGNLAYEGEQREAIAAVDNEYVNNLDVSGALNAAAWSTDLKKDFFSMGGITVAGVLTGEDIAINDTISGFCVYATE